jgi:ring-1,2-phenylacetyl-CoA epoxidase subunit PaaC
VARLGDGTDESHLRVQRAVDALLPRRGELRDADPLSAGEVERVVAEVLAVATLALPPGAAVMARGRAGQHSPALAELLAEFQSVARAHPEAVW